MMLYLTVTIIYLCMASIHLSILTRLILGRSNLCKCISERQWTLENYRRIYFVGPSELLEDDVDYIRHRRCGSSTSECCAIDAAGGDHGRIADPMHSGWITAQIFQQLHFDLFRREPSLCNAVVELHCQFNSQQSHRGTAVEEDWSSDR